jgi:hypothetical protein
MFRTSDDIVGEAYARQGNEIAYREQSPVESGPDAEPKYAGGG